MKYLYLVLVLAIAFQFVAARNSVFRRAPSPVPCDADRKSKCDAFKAIKGTTCLCLGRGRYGCAKTTTGSNSIGCEWAEEQHKACREFCSPQQTGRCLTWTCSAS